MNMKWAEYGIQNTEYEREILNNEISYHFGSYLSVSQKQWITNYVKR